MKNGYFTKELDAARTSVYDQVLKQAQEQARTHGHTRDTPIQPSTYTEVPPEEEPVEESKPEEPEGLELLRGLAGQIKMARKHLEAVDAGVKAWLAHLESM